MRSRFVKEGAIKEFTIIPDFVKVGYKIMTIICVKRKYEVELMQKAEKLMMAKLDVIFVARAEGRERMQW